MPFQNDPLLMDLHSAVTIEEINAQIALEYGQAMTVNVKRGDAEIYRACKVSSFLMDIYIASTTSKRTLRLVSSLFFMTSQLVSAKYNVFELIFSKTEQ